MKQVTLDRANALANNIRDHESHLAQVKEARARMDDSSKTEESKALSAVVNWNSTRVLLQEHLMPIPTRSFMDMYIMQVERKIAELQAELDNLSDSNAV